MDFLTSVAFDASCYAAFLSSGRFPRHRSLCGCGLLQSTFSLDLSK
jgi:hypothetical protein